MTRFWQSHIAACKRAVSGRPSDPDAWEALADAHLEACNDLRTHPDKGLLRHRLAAQQQQRHQRAAQRAWERIVALQPTRTEAYLKAATLTDPSPHGRRHYADILDRGLDAMPGNLELLRALATHCSRSDRKKTLDVVLKAEAASDQVASRRLSEAFRLLTAYPEASGSFRGSWSSVEDVAQYLVWLDECPDWVESVAGPTWSLSDLFTALDIWTKWYMMEHDHRLTSEESTHHGFTVLTPDARADLRALRDEIAASGPPYAIILGDGSLLWGDTCHVEQPCPQSNTAQLRRAQRARISGSVTIVSVIEEKWVDDPTLVKLALHGTLSADGLSISVAGAFGKPNPLPLLQQSIPIYNQFDHPSVVTDYYECESPQQATELWWTLADGCGSTVDQDAEILHGPIMLEELAFSLSYTKLAKPLGLFPTSPAAAEYINRNLEQWRSRIERERRERCNE